MHRRHGVQDPRVLDSVTVVTTPNDSAGRRPSAQAEDLTRLEGATATLDPPFAVVDLDAFWHNARDLVRRASGKPIRLASKSVRCRELQERVLRTQGWRGTLAFTLPEALWLATCGFDDLVVAYPTTHRSALRELARREDARVTIMIDSVEQLELIDAVVADRAAPMRVCLDIDAGWWPLDGRVRIGAKRSPVHDPREAAALAGEIVARQGFHLVGLMAYEAQIAGVGDAPPHRPLRAAGLRAIQTRSARELADRRAEVVSAVEAVTPLEFVNGGGTGSLERTLARARSPRSRPAPDCLRRLCSTPIAPSSHVLLRCSLWPWFANQSRVSPRCWAADISHLARPTTRICRVRTCRPG